jgi:hypothetical protein
MFIFLEAPTTARWEQSAPIFVLNITLRKRQGAMSESTIEKNKTAAPEMHWRWLPGMLLKPRKTIQAVLAEKKAVWLTPLLVLSALIILAVLVAAPIQRQIVQSGSNIPENFQYWTSDEQNAFLQAQASQTSPLFLYVFPVLRRVSGYWLIWLLTSSLLHLAITLRGSRSSRIGASNLVAWSMTPFILRVLVEIFVILFTRGWLRTRVSPRCSHQMLSDSKPTCAACFRLWTCITSGMLFCFCLACGRFQVCPRARRSHPRWQLFSACCCCWVYPDFLGLC